MARKNTQLLVARSQGVATITLNRPETHNAFNDALIAALTVELRKLNADSDIRAVVLAANGVSFSAGADLNWMRRAANDSEAENFSDAMALAELLQTLHGMKKPTLARVHGAAYGGGVGLVAACDIAIAAREATFCFPEVRLGLIPAVISPYVMAAIGERYAQRYFLTAERFDAAEAYRIGLVHDLVEREALDATIEALLTHLRQAGMDALRAAKDLIGAVAHRQLDATLAADTARRIARTRKSREGIEGIASFLEKRPPTWLKPARKPRKPGRG